jgi:hypothetical protein
MRIARQFIKARAFCSADLFPPQVEMSAASPTLALVHIILEQDSAPSGE